MGLVLWGRVSDEVAARLEAGTTKLRPQDWKSGDKLYAVEVIAPFGGAEEMIKDLKEKVFPTETVRYVAVTKEILDRPQTSYALTTKGRKEFAEYIAVLEQIVKAGKTAP